MEKNYQNTTSDRILKHLPDIVCCIDKNGHFLKVSEACKEILGYETFELEGRPYLDYVLKDDRETTLQVARRIMSGKKATGFKNRYTLKGGGVKKIEWSAAWSPEENLMFCTGREATDQPDGKTEEPDCLQWFQALFDKSPDVAFYENRDGAIIYANRTGREMFHLPEGGDLSMPASAVLPPEMASVNQKSHQEALLGSTLRFDLSLTAPNGRKKIYDTIKSPITINGVILGVQTIAKDITPIIQSFDTIERQAKKLNTIFESITDAFFTLDKDMTYTYINSEFERITGVKKQDYLGKSLLETSGYGDKGVFYQQYRHALETGESVHFEGYAKKFGKWLEVKCFPSEEGLSVYFTDITEKVKSRKELEKLSLVASNTTNGVIITHRDRTIEWVNEGFTKLTGYTFDEALGKIPSELLHHEKADTKSFDSVKDRMIGGKPVSFEILNRKKNGEDIWLSIQVNPIFDEDGKVERFVTVQTDITDLQYSNRELEKLSLVASKANNSVLIADKDWKIEWANDGFTRLMGYSLEEAVGKRPSELLHNHKTDRTVYEAVEGKLLLGEPISLEVMNVKKNGDDVWINAEISPILDRGGEITRFIEVQTDITALKNSELELAKLAKALYRQNSDLQQFTYIVSHNLRSPVANVMGLVDLLTSTRKDSKKFDTSLSYLKQVAFKLDTTLRDMNTILSIRDSKESLEREQVDINAVLQQVLLSFKEPLQKNGARVTIAIPEQLSVSANKAYLYSIFHNLVSNSIKYRRDNHPLHIRIKCFGNAKKGTVISFSDNGSGFDMEKAKDDLFKMYKRFHFEKEGRGMGLYLVKNYLEAMGGHIEAASAVGIGTRFLIYLPTV